MTRVHVLELEKAKKTKKIVNTVWAVLGWTLVTVGVVTAGWLVWLLFSWSTLGGSLIVGFVVFMGTIGTLCELEEKANKTIDAAQMNGTVDD